MYTEEESEIDDDFCEVCGMDLGPDGECLDCNMAKISGAKKKKEDDKDEIYDRRERR